MADEPKKPVKEGDGAPASPPEPGPPERPRRVNPPGRRYGDKQLRPDRLRGGFDTK